MASIHRRGPTKIQLERLDTSENLMTANAAKINAQEINNRKTPPRISRASSDQYSTVDCDVCKLPADIEQCLYCPVCKQKLCDVCAVVHNRLGGTRSHIDHMRHCEPECKLLQKPLLEKSMKEKEMNLEQFSSFLIEELGVQVCYLFDDDNIEIRAPFQDVIELAIDTIHAISDTAQKSTSKRIRHGVVEWKLKGNFAEAIPKLFHREISSLIERYDVDIKVKKGCEYVSWPLEEEECIAKSKSFISVVSEDFSVTESEIGELIITCTFENYYAVDCEIEGIKDEVQTLLKAELLRPKQDEFRMKMYAMLQEKSDMVLCHVATQGNMQNLVIEGREASTVDRVKQEFLSLFCKECSACGEESSRPTYLECKHVLCNGCVKKTGSPNTAMCCPLCADSNRQKTPISSLQLQCLQAIDRHLEGNSDMNQHAKIIRRKSSVRNRQYSTKIPKYLLNKWKKATGGITRLRSLIENNYGLMVAGSEENIRISGQQQDILELAVQSLEKLNEKTPETGITHRLADKCVEWRFRGDHARIAQFLFNKELHNLKKKYQTVTIQVFTELEPAIVDVKCGYAEFLKVRYEMEELENDLKNLYTDEFSQPRNFYHNINIKDYLQSKRRDNKVHCTLVERNNLNVIVIRGRKKEYVTAAKEQLQKW